MYPHYPAIARALTLRARAARCQDTADAHTIAGRTRQARAAERRANRARAQAADLEATIPGFVERCAKIAADYHAIQAAITREDAAQ